MNTQTPKRLGPGDDLEMITNGEDQWVHWPLLPVKNPRATWQGGQCLGVIVAGHPTTIYLCNLFCWHEDAPTMDYPSVEALLADGWIVD